MFRVSSISRVSSTSRRALVAAGLALGLAWLTAPAVPLYDGVSFPDEPYRYVQPPPGSRQTLPPTSATGHVTAAKGTSDDFFDSPSAERGPQVEIYSSAGGLQGGPGVTGFDVRAVPEPPGPSAPGLQVDGNLYQVTLSSTPPGPITITPPTDKVWAWIALRATSSAPHGPVFVYRPTPGAAWQARHTEQTGNDVFAANIVGSGEYALAYVTGAKNSAAAKRSTGGGPSPLLIVLAACLGIVVVIIGAVRVARSRAR